MNIPAIQYVNTDDGVSIAYTVCGEGQPFVFLPAFFSHVQFNWQAVSLTGLLTALAERFRLVNYDPRGMGMSTRGLPEGLTLDDYMRDLDAVLERLRIDRFVLLGSCSFALLAAHYAARHPERVSALILVNGAVSWEAWRLSAVYDQLPEQDWELFLYNFVPRDRSPEDAQRFVEQLRQAVTQRDYLVSVPVWHAAGLDHVLPCINTPSLVLHSHDFPLRSVEAPLELARRLPNARLVLMDSAYLFGNAGQAIQAIDSFLAELPANEGQDARPQPQNGAQAHLTQREIEVLRLIACGQSNREIADQLVISTRTVERHITHIYGKIGARGKADATSYAMRHSLI